jgi:hypothetical protein
LVTTVYKGSGYIPQSVRHIAQQPLEEPQKTVHPKMAIDEARFMILLQYEQSCIGLNQDRFYETVAQFDDTARKWRELFEEHEKKDLIHVSTTKP